MAVKKLGYLGFGASDIEAWRSYATKTLGLMDAGSKRDALLLRLDSRGWRIGVHPSPKDDILYAGFEVENKADMERVAQTL